MKIYGISGLGADKRVFEYLTLDYQFIPIDWIKPEDKETIEEYSLRLSPLAQKCRPCSYFETEALTKP